MFPSLAKAVPTQVLFSSKSTTSGVTTLASNSVTDTNTGDLVILQCASQFDFAVRSFKVPTTTSGLTLSTGIISITQIGGFGLWYGCTGAGGFSAKTFTCNWVGTGPGTASVITYSGTNCSNATPSAGIGNVKACNGSSGTTALCSSGTTAANSLIIGGGNDPDNAFAANTPVNQTAFLKFNDATNAESEWYLERTAVISTAAALATMNITNVVSGDRWNSAWLEILSSASGPTTNNPTLTIKNSKMVIQNSKVTVRN